MPILTNDFYLSPLDMEGGEHRCSDTFTPITNATGD